MKPADLIMKFFILTVAIIIVLLMMVSTMFDQSDGFVVVPTPTAGVVQQPQQVQPPPVLVQPESGAGATCQTSNGPVKLGETLQEGNRTLRCIGENRWEYLSP